MIKEALINFLKSDFKNINTISEDNWLNIIKLSKLQNVSNILFFNLKRNKLDNKIPKELYKFLENEYQKTIFRNMKIKSEIYKIDNYLKLNNIEAIYLKGIHLINNIYEDISLRYMQDIDLLVNKKDIKKAYELITNLNYITENYLDEYDYNSSFLHHLPKMKKENLFLEIHSNIINSRFNIENILKNTSKINNLSYLDEIDLIIHLCIHISYQDLFCIDLRHYYDLFYIFKNKKIDLNKIFERSNKYNFKKGVFIVLKILEKLFSINLNLPLIEYIDINDLEKAIKLMWLYDKTNIDEYIEYKKSPNIYKEFKEKDLLKKIILFINKVFIDKEILKHKYKIDNKYIYFYYLVRAKDLIKNHYKSVNNKYYKDKLDLYLKIIN